MKYQVDGSPVSVNSFMSLALIHFFYFYIFTSLLARLFIFSSIAVITACLHPENDDVVAFLLHQGYFKPYSASVVSKC